ncbi:hypothetical protein M9H77_04507 [Catharanthus roseus]|uniref:Uncharacterized protein n=1 Tax=Catharanthus roseus TaxID=4058 RepID=A0ACC0CER1_CATRO|nr:hypothetical protein M9H77_04507 [Catharanthus roseus]
MAKILDQAVRKICKGVGNLDTFKGIMEDVDDGGDFSEYFKAVWFPRLGLWFKTLKSLPLASQETSAAMEFYHNQLRLRLINEKDPNVYQRADWLVDKLGTKVHSYFWLDEYSGKDDFARYRRDEWLSGLTAWRKSLKIPDADVSMEGECVKVIDQEDRDMEHVIWNPGSEYAICDCNWANKGNLCEHVIKTIKLCRDKGCSTPSVSMFQYNQVLADMLHCPPYDSLIRDHAVSLAVWVDMLINSQIGQENSGFTNPQKEQSIRNQDIAVANEFRYRNGNISSHLATGFNNQFLCCSPNDAQGAFSDQRASESSSSDENRIEGKCIQMQTDLSSISNYITQPSAVNGNTITDTVAENRDIVLPDVDQDLTMNLYSTNAGSPKRNGAEDIFGKNGWEALMDTEMESIDIPPPLAMAPSDLCIKTHQNGVSSNNDGFFASSTKPVEAQSVHMVSSDVVGESKEIGQEVTSTKSNDPSSKDYILKVNTVVDNTHPAAPGIVDFKGEGEGDTSLTSGMDSPVDIVN